MKIIDRAGEKFWERVRNLKGAMGNNLLELSKSSPCTFRINEIKS